MLKKNGSDIRSYWKYENWQEKSWTNFVSSRDYKFFDNGEGDYDLLKKEFSLDNLFLLDQTHSADIVELSEFDLKYIKNKNYKIRNQRPKADAIIISNLSKNNNFGFGILTADCAPLMFRSDKTLALVHSGWQGLANKIIEKVASRLIKLDPNLSEVVIGPCAIYQYEVGKEVIEQIGESADYNELENNQYFLDVSQTAANQLKKFNHFNIHQTRLCTITDNQFYSFRREQEKAGRHLTMLVG